MSAAMVKLAAEKMRERADAATSSPWQPIPIEDEDGAADSYVISLTGSTSIGEDVGEAMTAQDAEHIASWDPAVALQVADWLETEVVASEVEGGRPVYPHAIAVARAYLKNLTT